MSEKYMPRLQKAYKETMVSALMKELGLTNVMEVPKLDKIIVNIGLGDADRLVSVTLPRVRDFEGVSNKGFDGRGNYTLGLKEQIIFPEIEIDKVDKVLGMGITFVTTAKNDEEGRALLRAFGMPFAK